MPALRAWASQSAPPKRSGASAALARCAGAASRALVSASASSSDSSSASGCRVPVTCAHAASSCGGGCVSAAARRRRAPSAAPHLLLAAVEARHQQHARLGADAEALERLGDLKRGSNKVRTRRVRPNSAGCAHARRSACGPRALLVGDRLNTRSLCSVRVVGRPAAAAASALCAPRCSTKALGTMAALTNAASGCSAPATIFSRSSLRRAHAAWHQRAANKRRGARRAARRAARHAPAVGHVREQRGAQRASREAFKRKRRGRHGADCAAKGGAAWRGAARRSAGGHAGRVARSCVCNGCGSERWRVSEQVSPSCFGAALQAARAFLTA